MRKMFVSFESRLAPPVLMSKGTRRVYRFEDKGAPQALVQKLARIVSAIPAIDLLMRHGFLQEGGTLLRVLLETIEDAMFLSTEILVKSDSDLLRTYLEVFNEERIPGRGEVVHELTERRERVSRRDVRAAMDDLEELLEIPTEMRTGQLVWAMSNLLSGFVHASASQVMDMYGGHPPHFHLSGMAGTPLQPVYEQLFDKTIVTAVHGFARAALALNDVESKKSAESLLRFLQSSSA